MVEEVADDRIANGELGALRGRALQHFAGCRVGLVQRHGVGTALGQVVVQMLVAALQPMLQNEVGERLLHRDGQAEQPLRRLRRAPATPVKRAARAIAAWIDREER